MPARLKDALRVHPLVWGAVAAALFSWSDGRSSSRTGTEGASGGDPREPARAGGAASAAPDAGGPATARAGGIAIAHAGGDPAGARCGAHALPEGDTCVPLPASGVALDAPARAVSRAPEPVDAIPKLPERP